MTRWANHHWWRDDDWNRSIHMSCDTNQHTETPPHKGKVQGRHWCRQQCDVPAHLRKAILKEDQWRWIPKRTQSIHHLPHCLQWFSNQAVLDLEHPHRLDTKRFEDHQMSPHSMVCCWHTWTSNTWTFCLSQTQNCRDQLCCWPAIDEDNTA